MTNEIMVSSLIMGALSQILGNFFIERVFNLENRLIREVVESPK